MELMSNILEVVRQGARSSLVLSCGAGVVAAVFLIPLGPFMMQLFSQSPGVIDAGMAYLNRIMPFYWMLAIMFVLNSVMRGAGDTMTPMWISIITTVIIRVPIAYLWAFLTRTPANPVGSPDCIFASLLISWVLGAVITVVAYRRGKWRGKGITGVAAVE